MVQIISFGITFVGAIVVYCALLPIAVKRDMTVIYLIYSVVTYKDKRERWEAAKRRRNYEVLRALIVEHHLAGKGGMIVPYGFDKIDLSSFRPPMYFMARNEKLELALFWRKELMNEEVGLPLSERPKEDTGSTDGCH